MFGGDGIAARLKPGGVHVSMSTIAPSTARRLAEYHEQCGSYYVSAPVVGRPDAAQARRLVVITSGLEEAKRRVKPVLQAISRAIYDFGEGPEAANVAKLCNNFLLLAAMEAMGEALAMAEKAGVERAKIHELFTGTLFGCTAYEGYGALIAQKRHTPPGFRLAGGLKDIELMLKAAREAEMPMALGALVYNRLLAAVANGRSEMDWSAFTLRILEEAGIKAS